MEDFPKLSGSQVAILRAESSTGHVYDIEYFLATSTNQKVYAVFDNKEMAFRYIHEIAKLRKGFEYIVYDKDQKVIEVLTPE